MRRLWPALVAIALIALLPDVAHACPVCFDASDENRRAFLATAILLTILPFGILGGTGWWIRKRVRQIDEDVGPIEDDGRPEP
ncbi:MAG: hypothetical protein R3E98_18985 [Gemmatimonadota bacterium]|nr:hypothetical protein [Gemmatimonadota bacterium]